MEMIIESVVYLENGVEKILPVKVCYCHKQCSAFLLLKIVLSSNIVVDCNPLPSVLNGTITYSGFEFWDTATYSCDIGYNLILNTQNSSVRVCTEAGIWSDDAPSCQSQ